MSNVIPNHEPGFVGLNGESSLNLQRVVDEHFKVARILEVYPSSTVYGILVYALASQAAAGADPVP